MESKTRRTHLEPDGRGPGVASCAIGSLLASLSTGSAGHLPLDLPFDLPFQYFLGDHLPPGVPGLRLDLPFAGFRCSRRALMAARGAYGGMERDRILQFTPVDHPDARVQRVGFDLTDPYVEQCWSAVIGPSSTLLLRRLPTLWVERVPAELSAVDLSRSLGLGAGLGKRSRLADTLDRLVYHRLARPSTDRTGLDIYRQVPPLAGQQLERVPQWTRNTHQRLLGDHLEQIDDLAQHQASVASITARLDRIQHGSTGRTNGMAPSGKALGR